MLLLLRVQALSCDSEIGKEGISSFPLNEARQQIQDVLRESEKTASSLLANRNL